MRLSEREEHSGARGNADGTSGASAVQDRAVEWNSVRACGQFMTAELLLSINHQWATQFAGTAFAKDSREPFGNEPLPMTLAPDLDPNDESVQYLVKLGMLDAVECLVAPELAQHLNAELGGVAWQIERRDSLDVAIWRTGNNASTEMALLWGNNIPTDMLTTHFPEQLGSDVTEAIAYFRALQVHHRTPIRSLFITRKKQVLRGRYEGWPHQIGQCTPEEALILAGLVLRRRNVFIDTLRRSGTVIPHRYNWYCGAAQTLLPSYLNAFADLATDAEKRNATEYPALHYLALH